MDVEILRLYMEAMNKIDDHFEYSNESAKDRAFVDEVLESLSNKLAELIAE